MNRRTTRSVQSGFTLIELVVTLGIALVLSAVALPIVVGAVQNYRLNSIAQQTSSMIDLARYTAIRRNMPISLRQNGNALYVDVNGDTKMDANDPVIVIPSDLQIANGQPLTPASNSMNLGTTIDFGGTITFDYRGVVTNPAGVTFLALGYVSQAQYGTRAVTLTPMGQTKMWTAPAGGTWSGM